MKLFTEEMAKEFFKIEENIESAIKSAIQEDIINSTIDISINDYCDLIALLHTAEFKSHALKDKRDALLLKLKTKN